MNQVLSKVSGAVKNWWVLLIMGLLLVVGAVWMFRTPAESFVSLAGIFSVIILISGLLSVFFAFVSKNDIDDWGLFLAGGILDIVVGVVLLKYPQITMVLFSLFIGFWLLFRGVNAISTAFKLRKDGIDNWGWILFFGVLTVIFAFMSIINPLIGATYLVFTLALGFLLLGIVYIFLSFQLKKVKGSVEDFKGNLEDNVEELKRSIKS
ncbi:MAG: HdeD family acid-resistance protein [Flavobacteriaceae bacterium]|nr:HdeD family acid-resistance protein [Flavobacteriaceae bacterium]